jgi:hypothetical protein
VINPLFLSRAQMAAVGDTKDENDIVDLAGLTRKVLAFPDSSDKTKALNMIAFFKAQCSLLDVPPGCAFSWSITPTNTIDVIAQFISQVEKICTPKSTALGVEAPLCTTKGFMADAQQKSGVCAKCFASYAIGHSCK